MRTHGSHIAIVYNYTFNLVPLIQTVGAVVFFIGFIFIFFIVQLDIII